METIITVSIQDLRNAGACHSGLEFFQKYFGNKRKLVWSPLAELLCLTATDDLKNHVVWATNNGLLPIHNFLNFDLTGINFSDLTLDWRNFTGAKLNNAKLYNVYLNGTKLNNAYLNNISGNSIKSDRLFADCSVWSGSSIMCSYFNDSSFYAVTAFNSKFDYCDFVESDLRRINFFKSQLTHCNFNGSNLTRADFENVILKNCDFTGANLTKVDFSGADLRSCVLTNADLTEVVYNSKTKFPKGFKKKGLNMRKIG